MPPSPILVVGCGHSGTSIMLAMLAEHSCIYGVQGETNFLRRRRPRLRMASFYFHAFIAGKRHWAEKTPKHVHHIADMLAFAPSTKFVCMVRDGRDVALSIKRRTGSFEEGCRRWVSDNDAWAPYARHPNFRVVQYERLVTDPRREMEGLCAFLDLPFETGVLHPENTKKNWYTRTAAAQSREHELRRNQQINKPLFDDSGRWRKEISDDELNQFDTLASQTMERLGYSAASSTARG